MMPKLIPKHEQKIIYLKWQDAHSVNGWLSTEEVEKKIHKEAFFCEEIGWVVYEDKKELHMVSRRGCWDLNDKTYKTTSEYGQYQRIPKTWIIKRKNIRIS